MFVVKLSISVLRNIFIRKIKKVDNLKVLRKYWLSEIKNGNGKFWELVIYIYYLFYLI